MGARVERLVMLKIKSMAFSELVKVKAKIDAEMELRAAKERSRLIEAVAKLRKLAAKKSIVAPATRATRAHSLKGRKLPPLYRNPKNRTETWAGRGLRPRWLVAALKGGKKLEAFAIK
jgi:DNA-binding protein H-NS